MSPQPHPAAVLLHLLNGQPLDSSLDSVPEHWRALLLPLAAVPANPRLRVQAFQNLLPLLPDSSLAEMAENIQNPETLLKYVPLSPKQRQLIAAVSQIGPAMAFEISRHLRQDSSNIRKRLFTLVSLGQLERYESAGRIYYRLIA